jgi:tRNA (guanine-N7-)-methyltransferase
LTHPEFLQKYLHILQASGDIHLKTDSESLFEFSLNSFSECGLSLSEISLDLHRDGERTDLVMTEYESKFHQHGQKIFRCIATSK